MELISLGKKFVGKMKEYLASAPIGNTTIYSENTKLKYYQVDAYESKGDVKCSLMVKDKILKTTDVYEFNLTPELVKHAIERHYASRAQLFLFYTDDRMSEQFVAREMNKLLDSTDMEDEFIYGTAAFMCALCHMDEEEASKSLNSLPM
jgi:hypothetical protein